MKLILFYLQTLQTTFAQCFPAILIFEAVLKNKTENPTQSSLVSTGSFNGSFIHLLTEKFSCFKSLFPLWGKLSMNGRAILYENSTLRHYNSGDVVIDSVVGSNGFVVEGECKIVKYISIQGNPKKLKNQGTKGKSQLRHPVPP